jgi:hypothetical protein
MDGDLGFYLGVMFALALGIELLTTVFRVSFHLRSARVQRKLHWPRIHHAYPGVAFVASYTVLQSPWLWVIGGALVLSDLFHHLIAIPMLRAMHVDVCMTHHERAHLLLQRVAGLLFLVSGLASLVLPFALGSFMVLLGILLIGGRSLVRRVCLSMMSLATYKKLKINALLERFHVL